MEANNPKRRLKRTSDWAFLDATFAWATSPRPSAARVWCKGERLGETRSTKRGGIRGAGWVCVNQNRAVLTSWE